MNERNWAWKDNVRVATSPLSERTNKPLGEIAVIKHRLQNDLVMKIEILK